MSTVSPRLVLLLVALVTLSTGCRLYGGWDSEELTLAQIDELNASMLADLERARADVQALELAASVNPAARPLMAGYTVLLQTHEAVIAENLAEAAELREGTLFEYRAVSRALGAMLAERETLHDVYRSLRADVVALADSTSPAYGVRPEAEYAIVPPFFSRAAYANEDARAAGAFRAATRTLPQDAILAPIVKPQARQKRAVEAGAAHGSDH